MIIVHVHVYAHTVIPTKLVSCPFLIQLHVTVIIILQVNVWRRMCLLLAVFSGNMAGIYQCQGMYMYMYILTLLLGFNFIVMCVCLEL